MTGYTLTAEQVYALENPERDIYQTVESIVSGAVEAAKAETLTDLRTFLPEWGYPTHVVAAICLEIKARIEGDPR